MTLYIIHLFQSNANQKFENKVKKILYLYWKKCLQKEVTKRGKRETYEGYSFKLTDFPIDRFRLRPNV